MLKKALFIGLFFAALVWAANVGLGWAAARRGEGLGAFGSQAQAAVDSAGNAITAATTASAANVQPLPAEAVAQTAAKVMPWVAGFLFSAVVAWFIHLFLFGNS